LLGPVDKATTRPITDRVKTALFDRLGAAGRLDDAVVLDVFSGTGSMGIECLSRGADHVTFVERDRVALDRLQKNLQAIDAAGRARVLGSDALAAGMLNQLRRSDHTLIFLDPPYRMITDAGPARRVWRQMQRLADVAAAGAWLVLRTDKHAQTPQVEGWQGPRCHEYGSMIVWVYERER
jgi:16S rRNA (guanine966-N2)-methyltransferase